MTLKKKKIKKPDKDKAHECGGNKEFHIMDINSETGKIKDRGGLNSNRDGGN